MHSDEQDRPVEGDRPSEPDRPIGEGSSEAKAGGEGVAPGEPGPGEPDDVIDEDFQFVLRELLGAYQPILEEELRRAGQPDELAREALAKPPNCDDELELGDRIFSKFFSEEVAVRLLPAEARQQLGPIERWRWCFLHIRCCLLFGWLVCRGPRTFRAFVYYLFRYWVCVRQALGNAPIGRPLTGEEREDFQTLVQALAGAYKPYLTDQLATVEFPAGLPDEVLAGRLDCFEGEEASAAIFDRLLTVDVAPALLGREAFATHSRDPSFWFCRCWCLCAIRFGCCLARARSLFDVVRCLRSFRRCLRECFRPLRCDLTAPTGCAEEELGLIPGGVGLQIEGTAAGASFSHYTLEWRKAVGSLDSQSCNDDTGWRSTGVSYPGGGASGTSPVGAGVLGWVNTTVWQAGTYQIRVCVYSAAPSAPRVCCCHQFALFKKLVWIERVGAPPVQTPPGPFVSNAPIVSGNPGGIVVPVGCCVTVKGSAFVGDCDSRKIKCFDLRFGVGFLPGPNDLGFSPAAFTGSLLVPTGPVCYPDPDPAIEDAKRAPWNWVVGRALTTRLVDSIDIDLGGGTVVHDVWKLQDFCFDSASLLPVGVMDATGCPDPHHRCRSGQYTLLLDVTDTLGNHYYDTQQVWFDNKPMVSDEHVVFAGLEGLPACSDLSLRSFVPQGAPCMNPWAIGLLGIAYDEYIDETDATYPSDNFDYYSLAITRQGGPTYQVPITLSLAPPMFGPDPFKGTQRVGDPGTRCEPLPSPPPLGCPPPPPIPPQQSNLLSRLDLRIFDATCAAALLPPFSPPAGFALRRGECCGYTFQLYAQDKTWSDSGPGVCHHAWSLPWAVCICNDIDGDIVRRGDGR
jgi:hypothetical protein